jgi:hypothetical protein
MFSFYMPVRDSEAQAFYEGVLVNIIGSHRRNLPCWSDTRICSEYHAWTFRTIMKSPMARPTRW